MEIQDIQKFYESNLLVKVIVNAIPHVGGPVDVVLTHKWAQIQQQRVNDLLEKISVELAELKDTAISKSILESEEFYDFIYQIANHAIESRCGEKRAAFARIIKSAIIQDKSIFDLEDIVRQVAQTQEKDLLYLKFIKSMFENNEAVTGVALSSKMSCYKYTPIDAEIQLYRFENLGMLDHARNTLSGRGKIAFQKMPLFDETVLYLGL